MSRSRIGFVLAIALVVVGCHGRRSGVVPDTGTMLVADSSQYTVRLEGYMYRASIRFHFTNRTGKTLSQAFCNSPIPPELEKQRADGSWTAAYGRVLLTCLTWPPLRIPDGGTYEGRADLSAAQPGHNVHPMFTLDTVPGIYRLRWDLRVGSDPDNRDAPVFQPVSPPFRLILR